MLWLSQLWYCYFASRNYTTQYNVGLQANIIDSPHTALEAAGTIDVCVELTPQVGANADQLDIPLTITLTNMNNGKAGTYHTLYVSVLETSVVVT